MCVCQKQRVDFECEIGCVTSRYKEHGGLEGYHSMATPHSRSLDPKFRTRAHLLAILLSSENEKKLYCACENYMTLTAYQPFELVRTNATAYTGNRYEMTQRESLQSAHLACAVTASATSEFAIRNTRRLGTTRKY
jgi:hypothetical protein